MSPDSSIGWIGSGMMGSAMCGHLLTAGHRLVVHSRTRSKTQPLLGHGAQWADSPRAVAQQADVVFTMVGFPDDVRQVYLSEHGILAGVRSGAVVVDMTTTSPSLACEIHEAAKRKGVSTIDAPVSGGDVGARNATLAIMVGGEEQTVQRVMPLLQILGRNIVHQGGPGAGQHAKMCNQIVIASTMIGVCEALLYGRQAGLDLETMLKSIRSGAAGCWTLENLAPRILKGNFDPGFMVEHFIKDMGIALEEAKWMRLELPGLALAHQLYQRTAELGHGRCGTHALMLAVASMQRS